MDGTLHAVPLADAARVRLTDMQPSRRFKVGVQTYLSCGLNRGRAGTRPGTRRSGRLAHDGRSGGGARL